MSIVNSITLQHRPESVPLGLLLLLSLSTWVSSLQPASCTSDLFSPVCFNAFSSSAPPQVLVCGGLPFDSPMSSNVDTFCRLGSSSVAPFDKWCLGITSPILYDTHMCHTPKRHACNMSQPAVPKSTHKYVQTRSDGIKKECSCQSHFAMDMRRASFWT